MLLEGVSIQEGSLAARYDVAADGRFLMAKLDERYRRTRIRIVQNWFLELERLVPTDN